MSLDVGKLSNIAWKIPDTLKGQRDIGAVNIGDHYTPSRLYYGCEDGRLIPVACQEDIEAMYGQRTEIDLNVTDMLETYLPSDFQFEYTRDQMKKYIFPFIKKTRPENRFKVPEEMLPSYWDVLKEDGSVDASKRDTFLAKLKATLKKEEISKDGIAENNQFNEKYFTALSKKLYMKNPLENPHIPLWNRTFESSKFYGLVGFGSGTLSGLFYWYGLDLFQHHYKAWQLISGTAVRFGKKFEICEFFTFTWS